MRWLVICGNRSPKWGIFAIVFLLPALALSQPTWSWAEGVNAGSDQEGFAITTDGNGDNISTGYIKGSVSFDGNPVTTGGSQDIYITKYDSSGNGIWAVVVNGTGEDAGYGITCDTSGNIYICGKIGSNVTCYGNPNIGIGNYGGDDIFVAKYSPAGQVVWARHAGSTGDDRATAICTNGNSVFVTGAFSGTATFGVLPAISSIGGEDVFIAAFSCSNGNEQWALRGGTAGNDFGDGIAADSSGIYVCGTYSGATCTFQNHSGSLASIGGQDIFLVKYNLTGTAGTWKQRAGGSNNDEANCLALRGNFVYIGGYFDNAINFYNGGPPVANVTAANNHDALLVQYDATNGNFSWARSENGNGDDHINEISTDTSGNIYTTGHWNGTLPFGSGPSVISGNEDIFVTGYDPDGNFLFGERATGGNGERGYGICVSLYGDVYVTGYYESGNTQFGSTPQLNNSSEDIFIAKLICDVTSSDAGADQNVCSATCTLNGNVPSNGTGIWSIVSGSGNILNTLLPGTVVTSLGVGQNVFRWTIINGPCISHDDVTITRYAAPTQSSAGSDQILCSDSTVLNANTPTTGSGTWSLISGSGIITNVSSPSSSVTALGAGQNVFEWSISNFSCPVSRDTVVIQTDAFPTVANAGVDQVICSSSATVNGNIPSVGTGMWSTISGSGNIIPASSPTAGVSGMLPGINSFEWQISNGVCPVSRDTVLFIVDAPPTTATTVSDYSLCSADDTLTGSIPVIGNGVWTLVSGSGTIANPALPLTAVTQLGVGINEFVWTISNGVCPASRDTVAITRDDFPSMAIVQTDFNTCSSSDTITANTPVTGTGTWSVLSGAALLADSSSSQCAVSNFSVGQNIFIWTISNGVCPDEHDTLFVGYNEAPSLPVAGADLFVCEEQVTMQAEIPVIGTGIWTSLQNSPPIIDSTNPGALITSLDPGLWLYSWTTQNGFCISAPDTIAITVYALPDSAMAGADRLTYTRSVQLDAVPVSVGTGTWSFVQGSGTFSDVNDPNAIVSDLAPGSTVLRWTCSNGNCPDNSDDLRIEVLQLEIPEGYSPNGDGVNDNFEITGLHEFRDPSLEVFNRWGLVVYSATDYQNNWNGTGNDGEILPEDVYYYVLKPDTENVFSGFVVLKRSVQ